jgi:hypothetical protein
MWSTAGVSGAPLLLCTVPPRYIRNEGIIYPLPIYVKPVPENMTGSAQASGYSPVHE